MGSMDINTLKKLSYGLFVLTTRCGNRDNGCIINVAAQVSETPLQMVVAINKHNLTHDMVMESGCFNLNVLSEEAPMKLFQHFGFQSGHEMDKFADDETVKRSANEVPYLPEFINGYLSGKVVQTVDLQTHTLFVAEIVEAVSISSAPSMTYDFYQKKVKPQPEAKAVGKTRWVCEVCGYVYEGEEIPDDFICPWCKHGKESFVKEKE